MKKIFTLTLGLMLTVAMFAADRRPVVTITSARKYTIVIDGRQYVTNGNPIDITSLFNGRYDIQVFKGRRGMFTGSKKLVASSAFQLRNNDVQITIDRFGHIQIAECRFGPDWDNHEKGRFDDRDGDHRQGHDFRGNSSDDHRRNDDHDRRF